MKKLQYTQASKISQLEQIVQLQGKNQEKELSYEELTSQGFVTVQHDQMLLQQISGPYQHTIAIYEQILIGYALVMLKRFSEAIPILVPMFQKIELLHYKGQSLANSSYVVMGQVCIDKPWRGKGVFSGLYQEMKRNLDTAFQYCITEVATRNLRSIRAHEKVGFQIINRYKTDSEEWVIMLWDWR